MTIKLSFRAACFCATVCLSICVLFQTKAFALAWDNAGIGGRGMALASNVTGLGDDSSAVFYNPAGMVFRDGKPDWDSEFFLWASNVKFTYFAGSQGDSTERICPLGGFFLTKRMNNRMSLGYGFYTPYAGGGTKYENFLNSGYESSMASGFTAFTPAIGYKINDQWAVGFAVSGYYGTYESKLFHPAVAAFVESEYDGFAGIGAHGSVFCRLSDRWSFGLTVRSPVEMSIDGDVKFNGANKVESEFKTTMPWYVDFGAGFKPIPKLTIGSSLVWMGYGQEDELTITTGGAGTTVKEGFKNSWRIGIGAEYQVLDRFFINAGAKFLTGSVKDEYMSHLANDINSLQISTGVNFGITKTMDLGVSLNSSTGFEKKVEDRRYDQDCMTLILYLRAQW